MLNKEKLTHMKVVRMRETEYLAIEQVAEKLDLTESEVLRRSIRIALPLLQQLNIPGNRVEGLTASDR